jgi:2',3'-cyclic-nucleotide 2'-phosphodiesterase (5'-nucleotidase family)
MVPMVTERMKMQSASQYLWTNPVEDALQIAEELRPQVDVVIALTHIGFGQDKILAERASSIDLILGGHSHTVLEAPVRVGSTWIAQGGSHSRFAGAYLWDGEILRGELISLR